MPCACALVLALSRLTFASAAMLSAMCSTIQGPVYVAETVRDGLARNAHAWVEWGTARAVALPSLARPSLVRAIGRVPPWHLAPGDQSVAR
jgi:hypothetical protein